MAYKFNPFTGTLDEVGAEVQLLILLVLRLTLLLSKQS